ncbi:MAG: hypothetical protein KC766_22035 [Myxococcales bacterium]|nr:hypothetical protein [Myxococcales bacterium]
MQQPSEINNPIRLGDALRSMRALLEDPDDTRLVFEIIEALSGNTGQRLLARLRRTESGSQLLADRGDVLPLLRDRTYLTSLPEGSLGRAYLAFLEREGITAAGLVEASETGRELPDTQLARELLWLHHRLRDSHDLWHAVTGYQGDLIGEGALLAFSFAQTRNPGIGFIVAAGLLAGPWARAKSKLEPLRYPDGSLAPHPRRVILEGLVRGLRAKFFPAVKWEELLARPLEEVRRELAVGAPPRYQPVRSHEVDLSTGTRRANPDYGPTQNFTATT